jgi:hypothetical protein
MTENSLLIRSRRRAKALSCASEAAGDAADLLNAGRGGNLGPAEASIWRMPVEQLHSFFPGRSLLRETFAQNSSPGVLRRGHWYFAVLRRYIRRYFFLPYEAAWCLAASSP